MKKVPNAQNVRCFVPIYKKVQDEEDEDEYKEVLDQLLIGTDHFRFINAAIGKH